jgi:hypothetical protein
MPLLFSSVQPNVSSWPGQSSYALLLTGALSAAYRMLPYVCSGCLEGNRCLWIA